LAQSYFQYLNTPDYLDQRWQLELELTVGPEAPGYEYLTYISRSLLPVAEKFGVTTAEEVQIDTLSNRIRNEVIANDGVIVSPAMIGAWAIKPY
jgi:hypothetical protein